MNRLFFISLLLLIGCKKKEVGPQCPSCSTEVTIHTKEVLIGCEGNFGWGNASLTLYDPMEMSAVNGIFSSINGYNLGDVVQSFEEINGDLYVVVNNSGKVEVLDTATYQVKQTISGLTSPRYISEVGSDKAYISDLYSNQISVVDLSTYQVTGTIATGGWTEKMQLYNDKVFVTRPDTNLVLIINSLSDQIEDTLFLSKGPSGIVKDKNNNLWILCDGGYNEALPALYKINPNDYSITDSYLFSSVSFSPGGLAINSAGDQLYYLNSGLYSLSITDGTLPQIPLVEKPGINFYGLGIDPNNNDIYLTDPKDYVQAGTTYRFDSLGTQIDSFSTGIIPQAFWFK